MPSLEPIVAGLPLFAGMKEEHIVVIADCARNVRFDSGEFVGRVGQPADSFWAIREGRVALQIHSPSHGALTLQTVSADEILGWSWLVPPHQWHLDARALTNTRAIVFDGRCLRGKFADDYELGYEMLRRFSQLIAGRLESTGVQVLELMGDHA